jgi:hypothetical protein
MQSNNLAEKPEVNKVVRIAITGSEVSQVHAVQQMRGLEPCFRTEERLICADESCEWSKDCRRLVAIWRR